MGKSKLSNPRLFDFDPITGVKTLYVDRDDGGFDLVTIQDCSVVLDHNKAMQNLDKNKKSEMWHAASIPPVIEVAWRNEGVRLEDKNCREEIRKRLNSSDWAYLRADNFRM